jgi:hypothetical protein
LQKSQTPSEAPIDEEMFEGLNNLIKMKDRELISQKHAIDSLKEEASQHKNKAFIPKGYD